MTSQRSWLLVLLVIVAAVCIFLFYKKQIPPQPPPRTVVQVTIANNCSVNIDPVTITTSQQIEWKAGPNGAVIQFNTSPFSKSTFTIVGANVADSGTPNVTGTFKYSVSVTASACSLDPKVIITR